ncbi:MAG TPA: TIGR02301 family protein [Xanthobacteraceae bacterium]|nr:TIGR02301 family protein [Xanthobacteraceae bacterium]
MRVHSHPCRSMGRATMFAAMRCAVAILLVLSFAAAPAQAQFWMPFGSQPAPSRPKSQPQTPALPKLPATAGPTTPPPQDQPAPYDRDLQRLSEILGALHFLRGICGSNEGQKWRDEAQTLIEAEAPNGDRHDQMVASFNRGYRGFQQSYRTCTPAADTVIRRYLEEGAKLARDITARYAN